MEHGEAKCRGGTESWGDLRCFRHVLRRADENEEDYNTRIEAFFPAKLGGFRNRAARRTILKSAGAAAAFARVGPVA
jgi:hypothetical protein